MKAYHEIPAMGYILSFDNLLIRQSSLILYDKGDKTPPLFRFVKQKLCRVSRVVVGVLSTSRAETSSWRSAKT